MRSKARHLWALIGIAMLAGCNSTAVMCVAADAEQAPQRSQPAKNSQLAIEPHVPDTLILDFRRQKLKPLPVMLDRMDELDAPRVPQCRPSGTELDRLPIRSNDFIDSLEHIIGKPWRVRMYSQRHPLGPPSRDQAQPGVHGIGEAQCPALASHR